MLWPLLEVTVTATDSLGHHGHLCLYLRISKKSVAATVTSRGWRYTEGHDIVHGHYTVHCTCTLSKGTDWLKLTEVTLTCTVVSNV